MNYLLINLAVADIIYATCTIPNMVLTHSSIQPNGATEKVLHTFGTFAWVGAASSVLTLVTVAEERYWSVMYYYDGGKKTLTMRKLRVYNKSINNGNQSKFATEWSATILLHRNSSIP